MGWLTSFLFFFFLENDFSIGSVLEFALEFRTWELNGILMSVADTSTGTSLALELVNGGVSYTTFLSSFVTCK